MHRNQVNRLEEQREKKEELVDKKLEFISSGILLDMAKDEYTKERERANALDSKASFFITVIVAAATVFVPIIPFEKLVRLYQDGVCAQKCIVSVFLVVVAIAFIFLVLAFRKLYDAYKLTGYKRPNLDCIEIENNHTAKNDELNKGLCDHYKTVVDDSIKVNGKKCDSIAAGIKYCGTGLLLLIISTIGLLITVGG